MDKNLHLPDMGEHRLLVARYTPVCCEVERLLAASINAGEITELTNVEVNVFLALAQNVSTYSERVARVMMKSMGPHQLYGEKNGLVIDPESWLHGFIVHMGDRGDLFLGRPSMRFTGFEELEKRFPGIYPGGFEDGVVNKKLLWNVHTWEEAVSAYCLDKYPEYGSPVVRRRINA